LVYPFSGLEAHFFFVYVPFVGRNYGREWKKNFSSILGKAYVDKYFQRFYGSGRKAASFFAMMLAGV
jgi:hypothetical protein